jgi:hypothetical protein
MNGLVMYIKLNQTCSHVSGVCMYQCTDILAYVNLHVILYHYRYILTL